MSQHSTPLADEREEASTDEDAFAPAVERRHPSGDSSQDEDDIDDPDYQDDGGGDEDEGDDEFHGKQGVAHSYNTVY